MGANGSVAVNLSLAHTKALDLSTPQNNVTVNSKQTLTSGNGSNQIESVWSDSRSVGTGGESIDLSGTSIQDAFGDNIAMTRVKTLYIKNTAAAGNLLIGGAAAIVPILDGTTDAIVLPPGGELLLSVPDAGYTVTATTADLLRLAASAGTVNYNIVVAGTTT